MNFDILHRGPAFYNGRSVYVLVAQRLGELFRACEIVDYNAGKETEEQAFRKARDQAVKTFQLLDEGKAGRNEH